MSSPVSSSLLHARSRHVRRWYAAVTTATLVPLSVVVGAPAAQAAEAAPTAPDLAAAIVEDPAVLTGAAYVMRPDARATMVGTTPIAGFPRGGSSFAILSSGKAADAYTANGAPNLGTSFNGVARGGGTDRDVTILRLDLNVPAGVNCMTGLDFRFFSEEFPEYVGDTYNDAFIAELDTNSWSTSGSTINAPDNFAFDPNGNPISINAAGAASMSAGGAAGTTYDGGSDLLTAATPITPGAHSIYLSIFDQGDDSYDSTVLLDDLRLGTVADVATDCKPGAAAAQTATPVTAAPVTHTDLYGTADDTYTIPSKTGVEYLVGGNVVSAGTYPGSGTVVVTARATSGHSLSGTSSWSLVFSAAKATPVTSSGTGTSPQSVTPTKPAAATLVLVDGSTEVSSLTVPGEGTYAVSGSSLTFTPVLGFAGTAPGVTYRVLDGAGGSQSSYVPTVSAPAGPTPANRTSAGAGTAAQHTTVTVPASGSVQLRDSSNQAVTSVSVPGQGAYSLDPTTGTITFTPVLGWTGAATAVTFAVTDAYGQSGTATYTPTVSAPAAPSPTNLTSSGNGAAAQHTTVTVPASGSVQLRDSSNQAVTSVSVPGQGAYSLDPTTGTITFTPVLGWTGTATAVTFAVTDAYGQSGTATYTPSVGAALPPTPAAASSTGVGTTPQQATPGVPPGGSVRLRDADGQPATTVTVPQGAYTLDPTTGVVTFVPVLGFTGTATPVTFAVTDAYGQTATSTYTPVVTAPAGPAPAGATSTGTGTAGQHATVSIPPSGSVRLRDAQGSPVTTVTVPGQGTYTLDPATGQISFAPVHGFAGQASGVTFAVTDAYAQIGTATYAPVVSPPPGPVVTSPVSTGAGTATQSVTVPVPRQGSVRLLDANGQRVTTLRVAGGTYDVDPATGVVRFLPDPGFLGAAPPVTLAVIDAYGTVGTATYAPSVTKPAAPTSTAVDSRGQVANSQELTVPVPPGGSVMLRDADGGLVTRVEVPGQGTYSVVPETGRLTFVPAAGFKGAARAVRYVVTDSYGQAVDANYTAHVTAGPVLSLGHRSTVKATRTLRTTCSLTLQHLGRCTVSAYAEVGGARRLVGRGEVRGKDVATTPVGVRLNALGRSLVAQPGGALLSLTARGVSVVGVETETRSRVAVVAPRVQLETVYFGEDSATVSKADLKYLRSVRERWGLVKRVTCTGHTDARGTESYNSALALRRAKAVCADLMGWAADVRAEVASLGERDPAAGNGSSHARSLNRRVEIVLRY